MTADDTTMHEKKQSSCWSFIVVFGAFIVISVSCGTVYSTPIAMVMIEQKLNTTYTVLQQSWLGATMMSTMSLSSILSIPAMRFIGCRWSIILGGFIAALGPATAVFAKSLMAVCLTMGILTGLGAGLAFIPSLLTVELHFPKKGNRLATSLALCGIGIGVGAYPSGLNHLIQHLEERYVLLVMAGALAIISIVGILMKSPSDMSSRVDIKIFQEKSLAKPAFLAVCLSNLVWSFGSSIMYIHIPVYALQVGHSTEQAAIMLSCIGGLSFFSRGMFRIMHLGEAFLMDTVTSVFCGLCLTAIMTGLFGDISEKYTGLLSYSMLFGFYCGFWSNFISQVNSESIGQDIATGGSGFAMLATAFGSLSGPPVAGFLYGETEGYKNIFYLSGSCMMFCSILLLAVKLGKIPTAHIRKELTRKIKKGSDEHVKEKSGHLNDGPQANLLTSGV